LLLSGTAFGQTGVRWEYVAPPECPSEQEFRAEVEMRLLRDPHASAVAEEAPSNADASVEVRLEPAERRASLVFRQPDAAVIERTVEGESCAELASGVALILALAFGGPQTPADPLPQDAPASEHPPFTPVAATSPASTLAIVAEAAPVVEPTEPPRADRDSRSSPAIAPAATPLDLEVGGGGWLNTWSAPSGNLGADVFVRVAGKAPHAWSARLAGFYGQDWTSAADRRAQFTFLAGRAEGCPLSRRLVWTLSGEACLALDLGALRGRGDADSALLDSASRTVFWAAGVLAGRLRARFGERISLEGQAELGFPLVRHEFVFQEPRELIFRIPPLGVGAGLALGAEIL
jgi:hypothetical protein